MKKVSKKSVFYSFAGVLSAVMLSVASLSGPALSALSTASYAAEDMTAEGGFSETGLDGIKIAEAAENEADLQETSSGEEKTEKLSFTERLASKFATSLGKYIPAELVVVIISMLPILELRAGLFVAKFLDLPLLKAIPLCIIGNIIPIPLILLFIKKIFKWLGKTKLFHKLIEKLEARAMKKSKALSNGEFVGLMLFVGIPIPGTGAWTGSLIAALLEVDFKKAILAELAGIAIATVIVSILSYGLLGIFI